MNEQLLALLTEGYKKNDDRDDAIDKYEDHYDVEVIIETYTQLMWNQTLEAVMQNAVLLQLWKAATARNERCRLVDLFRHTKTFDRVIKTLGDDLFIELMDVYARS